GRGGGLEDRRHRGDPGREHVDEPELGPRVDEEEAEGERPHDHVCHDHETAPVEAVGERAAEEGDDPIRQVVSDEHRGHQGGRVGEPQHEAGERDDQEPVAAEGDQLSEEEQAEVAVPAEERPRLPPDVGAGGTELVGALHERRPYQARTLADRNARDDGSLRRRSYGPLRPAWVPKPVPADGRRRQPSRYRRESGTRSTGRARSGRPSSVTVPSSGETSIAGTVVFATRSPRPSPRVRRTGTILRRVPIARAIPPSAAACETNVIESEAPARPVPPQSRP